MRKLRVELIALDQAHQRARFFAARYLDFCQNMLCLGCGLCLISVNAGAAATSILPCRWRWTMRTVDQELLEKTEIYQRLDPAIVERLVRDCPVREYPKNAILTQQGDDSEYVHLILSGRVALMAECCDGETTVVTTFGSGEIFVSAATILQMPYLVTA
ncbi:Crp/Fnr family transcriptional regulator, partial [Ferrovibrio sp.]|uniref:cyclic nucleotide-binding domain-containing protein n=1 Tax=Ferrovibrio sp. TaxID=1917215 RepID=UPI0026052574